MRVVDGIADDSTISAWHCYESLGGPPVLTLTLDENVFELYCTKFALKRLIDEMQREYDKSEVKR